VVVTGVQPLHYTTEQRTRFQGWLTGVWNAQWQSFIGALNVPPKKPPKYPGELADLYAWSWFAGVVPGITYGAKTEPTAAAEEAIRLLRLQVVQPLSGDQLWGAVNHPFHSQDESVACVARALGFLWDYPGFTAADKQAVAEWLGNTTLHFGSALTTVPYALEKSPGSEDHHYAYYGLAIRWSGFAEAQCQQLLDSFPVQWLNGSWLDLLNYESRGDFGQRVLGAYGNWYYTRIILTMHAWKIATGTDYINAGSWARNWVRTAIATQKPHKPGALIPFGTSAAPLGISKDVMQMLTGVLDGIEAQWAAFLGGPIPTGMPAAYYLQTMLTANPEVVPVEPPKDFTWFSEAYGLVAVNRADKTQITMGAPPVYLIGHTWAAQGGGPREAIPLGVTLTAEGVPVLVKHVGDYRDSAKGAYGQNAMRVYQVGVPDLPITGYSGGYGGTYTQARIVPQIRPEDDLGGIKAWTPGRAVADLTKHYLATRVTRYVRTYEWGDDFLRVLEDLDLQPGMEAWQRWYPAFRPVINGVSVPDGFTEMSLPDEIVIGPVTMQILSAPGARLKIVGGPSHRWVDDNDFVQNFPKDNQFWTEAGGALEASEWALTLIGGSGVWDARFTW